MWYRRYLINKYRNEYEKTNNIKYDLVFRTRFDIILNNLNDNINNYLNLLDKYDIIVNPDIFSVGKPEYINIESQLTFKFPYIYNIVYNKKYNNNIIENKLKERYSKDKNFLKYWTYMSEENLITFFKNNNIKYINRNIFKIIR